MGRGSDPVDRAAARWAGSDSRQISAAVGGSASRNAVDRPSVTVLWPPAEEDGFSLIADGDATLMGQPGPDARIEILVTSAVLHRRAAE